MTMQRGGSRIHGNRYEHCPTCGQKKVSRIRHEAFPYALLSCSNCKSTRQVPP